MRAIVADCRELLHEQFEYRELLRRMIGRDLLLRYKQTIMGFGWAIFMPLLNTAVFSVIFTQVAPISTPVAYPVFAYCGLWVWNFFSSSLRFAVNSLTGNINLVTKVYFPREILPFSSVVVCLVDMAVGSTVLIALMAWYRVPVGPHLAWLPLVVLVTVAFTAAMALMLAMANLYYRDVKYLFEVGISVWMFATSVLYPTDVGGTLGLVLGLNPMTPIVDAFRNVLLLDAPPGPAFAAVAAFVAVFLAVVWFVFHRAESRFAESI